MGCPLVTVIIPSYNHASYIEVAIKSVVDQTYENWELIVIDDGSTDGTHEILKRSISDSRISVILNNLNKGQSAVINQALLVARGDFVCFLPSDDWFLPAKLALQIQKFSLCSEEVGVVYGRGARFFSDTGDTVLVDLPLHSGWVLEKLILEGNFIYPVTPLFRRECFIFARPDETYKAEGEAIYTKISIKYKFEYVDDLVGVMRDHPYNTGKMTDMMYVDNMRYWHEIFCRDDLPQDIKRLKKVPFARIKRLRGIELIMLERRFKVGREMLLSSIFLKPSYVMDYRVICGLLLSVLPIKFSEFCIKILNARHR